MSESRDESRIEPEIPSNGETTEADGRGLKKLRRRGLWCAGIAACLLIAVVVGGYLWASSPGFENLVRARMIAALERSTGGRVEIGAFHWRLLRLEAEADGLVIHGSEAAGEAPYARVERLRVALSVLGLWNPHIRLRDLEVTRPALHLIVYPDGGTNQPKPRRPKKAGKPALDTLFDLKAGRIAVEQGVLHYEDRAADFDAQGRFVLLDFAARDVALRMMYLPAAGGNPESYRIEAGASDLNIFRGSTPKTTEAAKGRFEATVDLLRTAAYLRSLRMTADDHTLEVTGSLTNFAHPRWQAKATGELDMRLLEPVTGYTNSPEGVAHLELTGAGQAGVFRADGTVHVDGGSYIGTGVTARGVQLDARVHADPEELRITSVVARLRQGGQLEGAVTLDHWLPPLPGADVLQPAVAENPQATGHRLFSRRHGGRSGQTPAPAAPQTMQFAPGTPQAEAAAIAARLRPLVIPVNGKVTAVLKGVSVDTVLDIVGEAPYQRLGLNARLNGPATAVWTHGDARTLSIGATLNVNHEGQAVPGEVPTTGMIDGTYTQRDGSVDLRKLEVHLPESELEAHGRVGAYPLTSASEIAVDFHSRNLAEFDTILRRLGFSRNGKTGVAALPVVLNGQMDFLHGTWAGSLADPHIAGTLRATQLAFEMPVRAAGKPGAAPQTQLLQWDSIEASGSYSGTRVSVDHGSLKRGTAEIAVNGTMDAAPVSGSKRPALSFNSNSAVHAQLRASKVGMDQVLSLAGEKLPVTGAVDAELAVDGPVHGLGGTGWVELNGGTVYGEPVTRIRAQGTMANQVIKLASGTLTEAAGKISATGSYDMKARRFQINAQGAGIDVAKIARLRQAGMATNGKLTFTAAGSGTVDDPQLESHATLSGLTVAGEALGALEMNAHTVNRALVYDVTTKLEATEFNLHGQTALSGAYATQAKLEFSRFDIGALLKMEHVDGLSGDSALAGTVTVDGPLARPEEMRGEARLQQLAVTIAGVHLHSEGGVHATLAATRINLDPLHVTGEQTDLRLQGSLGLKDRQQVDAAASGSINLKLAETLDPDLTAAGITTFQVEAHGPLANPGLRGRVDFQNGALSMGDMPNGLSQIQGTLEFNQNRLEVRSLTAMSGGGLLSVGGYLAYQHGVFADLSVTGKGIRIRYPAGVSSLADATLRLQGAQNNLLLSGNVLLTRFSLSPTMDIASLAQQANAVQPVAPPDAPSNHIRMDVHIVSSPQLNFQNAYAKLAGDVDLRLRGTVASPSLLGRISITEGSATIAGTRYDLQSGDILFTNPVRIQPSIDLNATARVEDYDITLGLHGTPDKMAVTYRSDPPLPEADVVALLALGRTQNEQRLYTQQQEQSGSGVDTDVLLGGALNATVSSRVQKLFGAGSVKVDPNYVGALGNSTSRIIVEEQVGRNITLTYATDVDTTGQQLLQAEVAINRHVSLLVARDESGVFSMVLKNTRRYR